MAPSSPTNVHSGFVSMESNSDRIFKKLRPEATICKSRGISTTIVKERESPEHQSGLTIEDGHNVSSFEVYQPSAKEDYFACDETQSEVPVESSTIEISGFADENQLEEDFGSDPFGASDVVDELQEMIDSCDEDEGSEDQQAVQFEEAHPDFMENAACEFEEAASPLDGDQEFVAGQFGDAEPEEGHVTEESHHVVAPIAGCPDFSEIAAPPPLE